MNSTETQLTLFGEGQIATLATLLKPHFGTGPFLIVTDQRIWASLAPYFQPFLAEYPETQVHVLPGEPAPYASDELVARIAALLTPSRAVPIAVGAGTINDVTKRAAFETGRAYACVPTAPSVDGYTASGAAIAVKGFKTTLECPAPRCVVAEKKVVCAAPDELVASGYGDIIAKLTGGADWLLADYLGVERVDRAIWDLVQPTARSLVAQAQAVRGRDGAAIELLYKGLIATGIGMQRYRDSRPASGSEHLLSHVWEMDHLSKDGRLVSHGYKTGFGTLAIYAFMNELFELEARAGSANKGQAFRRGAGRPDAELLTRRLGWAQAELAGNPILATTEAVIRKKTEAPAVVAERVGAALRGLERIRSALRVQLPGFALLRSCLQAAGCPVEPAELGLTRKEFLRGFRVASLIRKRYTVLDLAAELGVLEETAERAASSAYFSSYSG